MENDIIVGLDIGTTKIACLIGRRDEGGKVKILGFAKTKSVGVERGVVRNITSTSDSIKKVVEEAAAKANVIVDDMYVGIAGQHIKSITSQGECFIPENRRTVEQEDIDKLINDQRHIMLGPGEEIIHIIPQTYAVDGEELQGDYSPVGTQGRKITATFHIVTGVTQNIINIRDSVRNAGYKVKELVLEPIASSYAVLDDRDKECGVALVDIGGGTTDIAVFSEGIIRHTAVIALAGNIITKDIKDGCHIMPDQAESLKKRYGSCLPSNVREDDIVAIPGIRNQPPREVNMRTLAGIIKARVEVILEQVTFDLSEAGFDGKRLMAGMVLSGGGAKLKHIKEFASLISCTETRIGNPSEHLVDGSDNDLSNPAFATGVGLVLYGIERAELSKAEESLEPEIEDEPESEPETQTTATGSLFEELEKLKTQAPTPAPTPEPEPEPKPSQKNETVKKDDNKKKPKEKKWGLGDIIMNWLNDDDTIGE